MENVLAAASFDTQKFYIAPEYGDLPESIKNELKILCALAAERLLCTIIIGFKPTGDIYFKFLGHENSQFTDDIGAELFIRDAEKNSRELITALKSYYLFNHTEEGRKIKEKIRKEEE